MSSSQINKVDDSYSVQMKLFIIMFLCYLSLFKEGYQSIYNNLFLWLNWSKPTIFCIEGNKK